MPQLAFVYRVLIASPSDCSEERLSIRDIIHEWNSAHSLSAGVVLEPVMWETHSVPEIGDRPQAIINRQLVDHCDLLVGAFWTRLGTPTGQAASGTAEEIERFRNSGKRALLYFSSRPVVPDSLDSRQYRALTKYKETLRSQGLYVEYASLDHFRNQFRVHLARTITELRQQALAAAESQQRVTSTRVYCATTPEFESLGFEGDVDAIQAEYRTGVEVHRQLSSVLLTQHLTTCKFDVLHLLGFVNPHNGAFTFDKDTNDHISAEGMRKLVEQSNARLVFLATCNSLYLAAQLSPITNVIAGHGNVDGNSLVSWEKCFYRLLGQGRPLTEAYEVARATSKLPIVLFLKKDTVLLPIETSTA